MKPRNLSIVLGGKNYPVRPLSLVDALRLLVLLAPYYPVIVTLWEQQRKSLRKQPVTTAIRALAQALKPFPDDFMAAFSILVGLPEEELAIRCTALELWNALPILDRANDFRGLIRAGVKLGLWHG